MNALPAVVMLQQEAPGPDYSFFVMMGMIFLIFYFLLIRPQQRKQKDHERLLKSIEKGDSVITTGGVHGRVRGVTDEVLTVEIATLKGGDRVLVKVQRGRVESVAKSGQKGGGDAKAEGKAKSGKGGEGS